MNDGALLGMSSDSLRAAVGPDASHNPNKTSIVRQFVSALNDGDQDKPNEVCGKKKDRAARRRRKKRARHPPRIILVVSDMVSRQ